jgi:manganese/zinc/iron transport system substrate-binding protein
MMKKAQLLLQNLLMPVVIVSCLLAISLPAVTVAKTYTKAYPIKIGATVGMVADIVRVVAGEKAEVKNIIGSGIDPHVYNPTRSDVATLLKSDIIFYAGLLLEGQMSDILVKVSRKRPVHAVTELLEQKYLIHDEQTSHSDPHVWMDVSGWMKAVEVVVDAMAAFDPPNKEHYTLNGASYLAQLQKLDDYVRQVIASIPSQKRVLVTAHDAFRYMGRAYGIEVVGIQGISTESEAGIKDINRIVDLLVNRQIPAVFVESSVSEKNVKALLEGAASRGHQVIIGGELFSDAMGRPGTYEGSYIGMIDHNATIIAIALGGKVPEKGMQGKLTLSQ